MCGIVCAFDLKQKSEILRPQVLEMAKTIRHRGPDWSGIYDDDKAILAHERLAIVDPASGKQPLFSENKQLILAANGEIYNHRELRSQFPNYEFQTESDCEVILALYEKEDKDFVVDFFKEIIAPSDKLYDYLEDKNITWVDDLPVVNTALVKLLRKDKINSSEQHFIPTLIKDDEDKDFALTLLNKTILNLSASESSIPIENFVVPDT